jgi:hypothetical protein
MATKTQTVRITLNPKAGTPQNCIFNGKSIVKTRDGGEVELAMESPYKMFKDWGREKEGDAKRKHYFRPLTVGEEILIKYNWELTEDGKFAKPEHKEQSEVLDFLKAMPTVEVKNGTNLNKKPNAPFLLEILEETTVNKVADFAKVLAAQNIVHDMDASTRRDIAYVYGRDVSKKDDSEVLVLLVGLARTPLEGFLLMDENVDEFLALYKKMQQENPEVYLKTLLNKAIFAKIIEVKNGTYYTSGGDHMGLSEGEAMAYLKDKKTYADSIKREIAIKFNESVVQKADDEAKRNLGFNPLEGTETLDNMESPDFNPLNLSKVEMKKYAELKNLPAAKVTNDPEKIKVKVEDYLRSINKLIQ